MIGFELRWGRSKADVTDHCTRSKGNLNRNPYCSCSHSIPFWTMKRRKEGEMGLWVALSGEVEDVGYDCYDYVVVYALWLFLSVLLLCLRSLCFRLFVYIFMSLLFMELLSTVFAMYCLSSFDSIRGVLLIDVSSFWVYWIKSSALCVHAHVRVVT